MALPLPDRRLRRSRIFNKKDFKLLIALLIGLSTVVKQHSSSSTMAMLFLIIAYFLIGIFPEKLISIKSTWAAYIMTSIMIALGVTTMAGAKLISYLGKATSFLKRTTMWAIAMNKIPKNFILGTGVISSIEMKNTFGYAQLHNSALTTVLWGGVVGLLLYSNFIYSLCPKYSELNKDKMYVRFMTILFASVLIVSLFDGIELLPRIYIFYIILARSGKIKAGFTEQK